MMCGDMTSDELSSAAAAAMLKMNVDAVVVGADRVVANGDTANKIGISVLIDIETNLHRDLSISSCCETS